MISNEYIIIIGVLGVTTLAIFLLLILFYSKRRCSIPNEHKEVNPTVVKAYEKSSFAQETQMDRETRVNILLKKYEKLLSYYIHQDKMAASLINIFTIATTGLLSAVAIVASIEPRLFILIDLLCIAGMMVSLEWIIFLPETRCTEFLVCIKQELWKRN